MKILFLDKVLLGQMPQPLRGVEIFNMRLIKDLAACGDELMLPVHSSWQQYLSGDFSERVELITVSAGRKPVFNGLSACWKLRRSRFDVLLLANVANGLLPAVECLNRLGVVSRCVLIAHREPSARFLRHQKRISTRVISVNRIIAEQFTEEGGYELSEVYYGVTDAERFKPADPGVDEPVRFCVVGQLDNLWKGSDTAREGFRKMREECSVNSELHLASFSEPKAWEEDGVIPYSWMNASEIPVFLKKMDVMIVPSRDEKVMRETFSQVIVQGMLCGLPVIAGNLPVLTEKLDDGGGLIFNNTDELAEHMKQLARDKKLRTKMGAQGRRTALERYVWDTAVFREKYLA